MCLLTLSVLVNVIVEDSSEGLLECTRVYGNLSRHARVRDVLARNKGDSLSTLFLSLSLPLPLPLSLSPLPPSLPPSREYELSNVFMYWLPACDDGVP
jgi:hypothetical protein